MTRNSFRSYKSTTTGLFSFSTCTCNMWSKTYPSTLSTSERGGMWYHGIPGGNGSWYQSFLQLDKFSIFSRHSDGPVFKAAVLKVNRTQNRRVWRRKILAMSPDKPYPFLANSFIFRKIMHRYTRCVSIVFAAHIVRRPSNAIASTLIRFLLSMVRHCFRVSQFTTS